MKLKMNPLSLAIVISLATGGCASELTGSQVAAAEDKQYVTGSNIPRNAGKSDVKTVGAEEAALSRAAVQMPPKGKGGG
jgi:hypothetical protein